MIDFSLIRWLSGVIGVIITLIVIAPFLLQSYGDVILTKMFFQTWCKNFEYSPFVFLERIFFDLARYYPWLDITKPDMYSLNGVNVYEQTDPGVKVGIW